MPVEIRTADGRHWARTVAQNHEKLPLIRAATRLERRRARHAFLIFALFVSGWLTAAHLFLKGL